jgi:hypothetical protein
MYAGVIFIFLLAWDAYEAFWWPTTYAGIYIGWDHRIFGVGVGTLIMVANVILLAGFTFGCNSVRHLVGGRMDCFSCPHNVSEPTTRYRIWKWITALNEEHAWWAWASLFSVAFTDLYIRLCAMGIWKDVRLY